MSNTIVLKHAIPNIPPAMTNGRKEKTVKMIQNEGKQKGLQQQ